MKRKIKIGIPRSLLYYRYGVLWSTFFKSLGCTVILSPETNDNIIKLIPSNAYNKCLSYQLYLGHILSIENKCDYILINNICDYGQSNKTCTILSEMTKHLKKYLTDKQILEYKIKYTSFIFAFLTLFKIGFKLTKNVPRIIYAYYKGHRKQILSNQNKENNQKNLIEKNNPKVLILSQFYKNEDKYITNNIISYLKKQNIIPLLSSRLNNKISDSFYNYYEEEIGLKYTKELLGSYFYYQNIVSGVIYISDTNCEIDDLIKNISVLNIQKPIININIPDKLIYKKLEYLISQIL